MKRSMSDVRKALATLLVAVLGHIEITLALACTSGLYVWLHGQDVQAGTIFIATFLAGMAAKTATEVRLAGQAVRGRVRSRRRHGRRLGREAPRSRRR